MNWPCCVPYVTQSNVSFLDFFIWFPFDPAADDPTGVISGRRLASR
jgi:hypothetical protein